MTDYNYVQRKYNLLYVLNDQVERQIISFISHLLIIMEPKEQVKALRKMLEVHKNKGYLSLVTAAKEFLRVYAGAKSSFYSQLEVIGEKYALDSKQEFAEEIVISYIDYLESGLSTGMSLERRAQIDTVSDYLDQAAKLLSSKEFHPGSACVIIGASLEEFLRTWVEAESLSLGNARPSLDTYSKVLREHELITKQDVKDITSWGGLRNHAAHGEWEDVSDRNKVSMMLQGVNLFMRQYTKT